MGRGDANKGRVWMESSVTHGRGIMPDDTELSGAHNGVAMLSKGPVQLDVPE
jgi:hypothetical protein